MTKLKRRLALLLAAVMLITALPIAAMAADSDVSVITVVIPDAVDLTDRLEEELKEVPLDVLLPDVDLTDVTELAWDDNPYDTTNNFTVVSTASGTIDLSMLIRQYSYYDNPDMNTATLEILKNDQLEKGTTRYIVRVKFPNLAKLLQLEAYQADKTELGSLSVSSESTYGNQVRYTKSTGLPIWDVRQAVVSMKLNDAVASEDLTARVYERYYDNANDAYYFGTEITDYIWEKDDEGYNTDWTAYPEFTVVLERGGEPVQVLHIIAGMGYKGVDFGFDMYTADADAVQIGVNSEKYTFSRGNYYYIYPENYDTWQSGASTLKLHYRTADECASYYGGIDCSEYEDQTDVTVYAGYYADEAALRTALYTGGALDVTGDIWGDSSKGFMDDFTDREYPIAFTVVVRDNYGNTAYVKPFYVCVYAKYVAPEQPVRVRINEPLQETDSYGSGVSEQPRVSGDDPDSYYFTMLWLEGGQPYTAYDKYYVRFILSGGVVSEDENPLDAIEHIYHNGEDVTTALFPNGYSYYSAYYEVDFSEEQPVTFTVTYKDGSEAQEIKLRTLSAEPPKNERPLSNDTYFNVNGVVIDDVTYSIYNGNAFDMPSYVDGSFRNGFQVLFVNTTKEKLENGVVSISFGTGSNARMYVDHDEKGEYIETTGSTGTYQYSGTVKSGVPLLFSAASESGTHLRNYWVTLVAKGEDGPELWVNGQDDEYHIDKGTGLPTREVYITSTNDYYDIFFANVGSEPLEDLEVTLSGNSNIRLDDYWTIGETKTLAAFTDTTPSSALGNYRQLENMAKIRIWSRNAGNIDAILTISARDQDPVSMKLTGKVGTAIVSSKVPDGVKYVPYSAMIQTNYQSRGSNDSNRPAFSLDGGVLPSGLSINDKTGEIYGVPQVWSDNPFTFTVKITQGGQTVDSRTFTMIIAENTDENVWNATDPTYDVIDAIGVLQTGTNDGKYHFEVDVADADLEDKGLRTFVSKGPYIYYEKVFLDGKLLTPGVDYTVGEGSTKLVLSEEALRYTGPHTLAIEFREGSQTTDVYATRTMKRTAQNYTIEGGINPSTPQQSGGTPSTPGTSGTPSRPGTSGTPSTPGTSGTPSTPGTSGTPSTPGSSGTPSTPGSSGTPSTPGSSGTPSTPPVDTFPFADVATTYWAYDDIRWVWDEELMTGTDNTHFSPLMNASQAQIVGLLANLAGVDLTIFKDVNVPGVASGAWYHDAAAWAQQTGILPDGTEFNGESGAYSRDGIAIMMVKYLASLGIDTTVGADVVFADTDQMSDAGQNAFRVLYYYGIFKGVGNNMMNPTGVFSRAELATLVHKISDFLISRESA